MVEAATSVAIQAMKWTFRFGFIMAGISAFIILFNLGLSLVFVTLNNNVLTDLLGFLQLWLPFNLNTLLGWLMTVTIAYFLYRLSVVAIAYMNKLVGD